MNENTKSGNCPAGCGRSAGAGMLLCRPCWHAVPAPLQVAVWRTWRTWSKDLGSHPSCSEYRAAADAAIAAARERVIQKELAL